MPGNEAQAGGGIVKGKLAIDDAVFGVHLCDEVREFFHVDDFPRDEEAGEGFDGEFLAFDLAPEKCEVTGLGSLGHAGIPLCPAQGADLLFRVPDIEAVSDVAQQQCSHPSHDSRVGKAATVVNYEIRTRL